MYWRAELNLLSRTSAQARRTSTLRFNPKRFLSAGPRSWLSFDVGSGLPRSPHSGGRRTYEKLPFFAQRPKREIDFLCGNGSGKTPISQVSPFDFGNGAG